MSRILPLEKDVNLDKRYINETDTITEPALAAVINGGGGGGSGSDIKIFPKAIDFDHHIEYVSLAEFAAEWELTEEEMYDLTFGDWDAIRDNNGILHFRDRKQIRMNGDIIDGIQTQFSGYENSLYIYVSDNCSVWSNASD